MNFHWKDFWAFCVQSFMCIDDCVAYQQKGVGFSTTPVNHNCFVIINKIRTDRSDLQRFSIDNRYGNTMNGVKRTKNNLISPIFVSPQEAWLMTWMHNTSHKKIYQLNAQIQINKKPLLILHLLPGKDTIINCTSFLFSNNLQIRHYNLYILHYKFITVDHLI